MEGRHWNATTGENNSAKSWRDWFVLFAFGTAYAITYHAPSRRHLPAAHVSTAVLKGGLALHKTALHVQGTSSKTGQAAASGGSLVASKTLSPVAVRLQRYARGCAEVPSAPRKLAALGYAVEPGVSLAAVVAAFAFDLLAHD